MLGPLFYPRRYPPSREPRPPRFERRVKLPIGWLLERLATPFARWDRMPLTTPQVDLAVRGLPEAFEGYRIALVSDLHHGPVVPTWWLAKAMDTATDLSPDLIVLGGDYVSHSLSDLEGLPETLRRLRARDGVVAVLGNHDHWVSAEAVRTALRAAGIEELWNAHRLIRRGAGCLAVAGVGDFTHDAIRLDDALAGVPAHVPRVLVSHNPDVAGYLPEALRVDVILSGHTHGGQAHWPLIGPLSVPSQFGKRFLSGRVRVGYSELFVSTGVGSAALPLRRRNPPMVPVVRLVAAEAPDPGAPSRG